MSPPLALTNEQRRSIDSLGIYATERERRRLLELITGTPALPTPLEKYCPHDPWPTQRAYLDLSCLEAFYGGAAAGGKSDALLMGALMYADTPGYSALILRRDTQRLKLSGGLIPRSHDWLAGKGPTWNEGHRRWQFETSGAAATLSFGYLQNQYDKFRYGSSEYQFIGIDELTELAEEDYLFLFSRLRRNREVIAPLRMRSASNPGGPGHSWVKQRFIGTDRLLERTHVPQVLWRNGAAYVPARIVDNPSINEAEYRKSLEKLPAVLRERLMNGDWSIQDKSLLQANWVRHYSVQFDDLSLLDVTGQAFAKVSERDCRRFATIDPAGTSAERAREHRGRSPSWSVIQIWDQPTVTSLRRFLLLRSCWRERVGFEALCRAVVEHHAEWKPSLVLVENEKLGEAIRELLADKIPIQTTKTGGHDKVARAATLITKLERGEILLPIDSAPWKAALEGEWFTWTGRPEETSDQIDTAAYAAIESRRLMESDTPLLVWW